MSRPKHPIDVPTQETAMFLASHIPNRGKILEVGCGDGHVARELLNRGYRVIGLDSDSDAIAGARTRGVSAVVASWPMFNRSVAFDAIAFTRSLHHINPLGKAIIRARELLRPGGLILVEDFADEEVDKATISWFAKVLRSKQARGLNAVRGQLVTELLSQTDAMRAWRKSRAHKIHSIGAITRAISKRFCIRATQSVPYFYRYLIPVSSETPKATAFVQQVFDEETLVAARGEIVLLGRRIIGAA